MTTLTRAEIGALGEQLAVEHLTALGLRVLTRNWRCRYGELDVIAADDAARTVVFVEVKTRTSDQFGGVSQAVTPNKVRRLRRLVPGDSFGDIALIDGRPRTATVRAETPLRTVSMTVWDFKPLLTEHPQISYRLLLELCRRLREAEKRPPL